MANPVRICVSFVCFIFFCCFFRVGKSLVFSFITTYEMIILLSLISTVGHFLVEGCKCCSQWNKMPYHEATKEEMPHNSHMAKFEVTWRV